MSSKTQPGHGSPVDCRGTVARLGLASALVWATCAPAADPHAPGDLLVTTTVLRTRDKVPPLGANGWGGCGAVEWAANNFVRNAGNEPVHWRNLHRVKACGANWFEIDGPGTSWYDLWASGFLSGASLRVYRLVDKAGQTVPLRKDGQYLDVSKADHVLFVGKGRVIPEGAAGFPDGGWIANTYANVHPNAWIRHGNLSATDTSGLENGRTYWYAVVAVSVDGKESAISNEVRAVPKAGAEVPPRLLVATGDDKIPALTPGSSFKLLPKVHGGEAPFTWRVVGRDGEPAKLPEGLKLDAATGGISGRCMVPVEDLPLRLKVTDAKGRSDVRTWLLSPKPRTGAAAAKGKPKPPEQLHALAGDGFVTLTWKRSGSPNVVAYRIKRSTAPAARQAQRVYVTDETPKLRTWDYVVVERRFGNFDMRYVNSRVRGIGNPMDAPAWYWNGGPGKVSFSLVPHPKPVPADMAQPGETCMQVKAQPGKQAISQTVFIGTGRGGESIWYGLLEPGRTYRLEVWLRQEGLADGGRVSFSYGKYYRGIGKEFQVTGQWRKYTHEFTGPKRPKDTWHFGHTFTFTGPGTLWMDNGRIFRCDRPEDAARPYVPNATVLKELLDSQPTAGRKAAHRIWFLTRDATMSSILSWHATSRVHPDWRTSVGGTMTMTLPMGLSFDLHTGPDAKSRMRPWLVLQHILHSEEDWLAFVEYLAAPYDPKVDTARSKPWAHRRWRQRGAATPWTDEFESLIVEFGNETWHNGVFDDWLGFSTRNAVHQGGREYGLFARYLIRTMKKSPYWASRRLDRKIRFALGANYDGRALPDGRVVGYGEEAMQACPEASVLGHANYVGPKWETGDYSARRYDDHGVQECLISFLTGPERSQRRMGQARDVLAGSRGGYDIAAYEGGPGGFALPGRTGKEQVETNERYGKSLGQGVGAFDAWMRSYRYGWTDQCYLGYGQGNHWASHTPLYDGFRGSPAWVVMALRNRYASGDLMDVKERSVPALRRASKRRRKADEPYPLLGAYAMRDGDRWAVFVVSRKLDGKHDGVDFGDGYTPVTLHLPFEKAGKITLHRVSGDPRWTNRTKRLVAIRSQPVPAAALKKGSFVVDERSGGGKGGMPPGAIYLYVFQAAN